MQPQSSSVVDVLYLSTPINKYSCCLYLNSLDRQFGSINHVHQNARARDSQQSYRAINVAFICTQKRAITWLIVATWYTTNMLFRSFEFDCFHKIQCMATTRQDLLIIDNRTSTIEACHSPVYYIILRRGEVYYYVRCESVRERERERAVLYKTYSNFAPL